MGKNRESVGGGRETEDERKKNRGGGEGEFGSHL